jgi:electron transfer flavoprotein alpha subunit
MSQNQGVMIFGEVINGQLQAITKELLGCGRKLASDLQEELSAILLGNNLARSAREAITFGAGRVYVADDPLLMDYQADAYMPVMERLVKQNTPRILLLGQTSTGQDLAPRIAFRLNTVATTGCTELSIDPESGLLKRTKPVYGGNVMAVITGEHFPEVVTVRSKSYSPLDEDASRRGEVIKIEAGVEPSAIRTRILEKASQAAEGIRLEEAATVIAGGRGIGSKEDFKQLQELARLLKGAIGASRPPCDNEWIADTSQIGLTGKIVAPDLYLAVALSGSSQHISGISGAKNIVAINKDPEANIFRIAHFGVVGDWKRVLPAFSDRIKELTSNG